MESNFSSKYSCEQSGVENRNQMKVDNTMYDLAKQNSICHMFLNYVGCNVKKIDSSYIFFASGIDLALTNKSQ